MSIRYYVISNLLRRSTFPEAATTRARSSSNALSSSWGCCLCCCAACVLWSCGCCGLNRCCDGRPDASGATHFLKCVAPFCLLVYNNFVGHQAIVCVMMGHYTGACIPRASSWWANRGGQRGGRTFHSMSDRGHGIAAPAVQVQAVSLLVEVITHSLTQSIIEEFTQE